MAKAPCLDEFITTESILQLLNSSVKTIPAVVACPWAPEDKLYLLPDGAGLYACSDDFAGDTIEVTKKVFNLKSTDQALNKLEEHGCITSVRDIPEEAVLSYELDSAKRASVNEFIQKQREALGKMDLNLDILSRIGLMPDNIDRWHTGLGQHIFFARKPALEGVLGTKLGLRNSNVMVLPYYDMPGRVSRLRCFFTVGGTDCGYVDRDIGSSGGLFMTDTVSRGDPLAIAVDDPIFAMQLQRKHANISNKPLPLVVYNSDTVHWNVWANRMVFWGKDYSVELFKQAKRLPNSSVSIPTGTLTPTAMMKFGSESWMTSVVQQAKPWVVALKDYITNLDAEKAEAVVRSLELTTEEQGHLLYECNSDEKAFIKNLFDSGYVAKTGFLGDRKLVERNDEWYYVTAKGRISRIANATFAIEKVLDCGDDELYYGCELCHEQKMYKFTAPADEFTRNPTRWLHRYMLEEGIGLLHVQKAWQNKLMDVAHTMSSYKIERQSMSTHVGWSPDFVNFSFPNVTLSDGRVEVDSKPLPGKNLPCTGIDKNPLRKAAITNLLEDTQVNRYFWATFITVVGNLTSKYVGRPENKTVFMGNPYFFEMFADMLGLCTVQLVSGNQKYNKSELKSLRNDDIPSIVFADDVDAAYYNWQATGVVTTAIPFVSNLTAEMLSSPEIQYMITKSVDGKLNHIAAAKNLFAMYVKDLQRNREYYMEEYDTTLAMSSNLLAEWVEERLPNADTTIITEAPLLIRHGSPTGKSKPATKLYHVLFAAIKAKKLGVGKVGVKGKKKTPVMIGDSYVHIHKYGITSFPTGFNLESLVHNAKGLMENSDEDFLLDKKIWDKELSVWNAHQIA